MSDQPIPGSSETYSEGDLRASALAAREEMLRYKWYLGVQFGHDPENNRPADEIFAEWIEKHAAAFRKHWEEQRMKAPGC